MYNLLELGTIVVLPENHCNHDDTEDQCRPTHCISDAAGRPFPCARAVALEGSLGRNGGSIAIANATLVQDADFCLWIETSTPAASATSAAIRDEKCYRLWLNTG